ncbi:hypothetical protein NFI96_026558 [Prochilodus magdalenae]|nr:hypothetical protein NFI96_026558 [Prochilodus magdalenae]
METASRGTVTTTPPTGGTPLTRSCRALALCSQISVYSEFISGADLFSNCTDECKALGHSDRCWMPSFVPGDGRQGGDYRSNLHVPGMDAVPDSEVQAGVAPGMLGDDRSFSTFGKDKSHHGTLTPHDLLIPSARAPYKPSYLCEYTLRPYRF